MLKDHFIAAALASTIAGGLTANGYDMQTQIERMLLCIKSVAAPEPLPAVGPMAQATLDVRLFEFPEEFLYSTEFFLANVQAQSDGSPPTLPMPRAAARKPEALPFPG